MKTNTLFSNWLIIILASLFLSISGINQLNAKVICVSNSGSNENPGTSELPYQNIQTGLDSASAGDTIKVAAGIYTEGLTTKINITLLGGYSETFLDNERDIFQNKSIIYGNTSTVFTDNNSSTIDGFIIDCNTMVTNDAISISNNSYVSHNIVYGLLSNSGNSVIDITGGASVINNVFDGGWYTMSINSGTGTPVIKNNIITGSSFGISTIGYDASVRTYNNVFGNTFNYTGFDNNPGLGDISQDPKFRDEDNNDFRIFKESACVDAGDSSDSPGFEPAPFNTRIDIGAYGGTIYSPYLAPIPAAPLLSMPVNNLQNAPLTITLKWTDIEDVDSFHIQVATDPAFITGIVLDSNSVSDTIVGLSDLLYSTTYYWRVNASVTLGTSDWSEVWQFTTYSTEPTCGDSIYNDWDGRKYATIQIGNKCWMSMNLEFQGIDTFNYSSTICPDNWHLPTIDEWSMLNDLYSPEDLLPEGKSGLALNYDDKFWTSYKENGPSCYYNDAGAQVCCYNIWGFLTSCYINLKFALLDEITDSINIIDKKVFRSGFEFDLSEIFYKVRCVCDSDYFGAPILIYPNNEEDSQPTTLLLQWNSVNDAETYHLQVSEDYNFTTFIINDSSITDISKQVGPLNISTSYYWRVRAKNVTAISEWSETWSFTTINSVGINELSLNKQLRFYPNPVNNIIYFEGTENKDLLISIISIDGIILKQKKGKGIDQIDIGDLQRGAYILKILGAEIYIRKFIKQ